LITFNSVLQFSFLGGGGARSW